MRAVALLFIIVGLFSATQAVDFDDLKEVGKGLLDSAVAKGKEVLTGVVNDFLSSLLTKFGKREVEGGVGAQITGKLSDLLDNGKKVVSGIFQNTLDKLKKITDYFQKALGTLKSSKPVEDAIDAVVEEHNTLQRRAILDLVQKGKDLASGLVDKFKGAVAGVKETASKVVSALLQKGADLLGKRDLSDHLQTIGNAIGNVVSPFKDIVTNLGNTLKGHFSNLVDVVKGHANALKDKLKPHVDDLKDHGAKLAEHGKNALGALSEVVSDILKQTAENLKPSIGGVKDTLVDAGKTVVDHFTGDGN